MQKVIRINDLSNAEQLLWNHNKEIGRKLSDEELQVGIRKFIDKGEVIGFVENERITAMLVLYCYNFDTLQAYICNVYVLDEYRGKHLSECMIEKAIEICRSKGFKTICLHVSESNIPAVKTYKKLGFVFTDGFRGTDREMILRLKR